MPTESRLPSDQVLERALRDSGADACTRRRLLERAAVGAAGLATGAALAPAGAALARPAPGSAASIRSFGAVAVTTEALTVTLLTELLRRVNLSSSVPAGVKAVFEGAYAAELDHFRFTRAHWRPTTTKFWIPDGFFGGSGDTVDLTAVGCAGRRRDPVRQPVSHRRDDVGGVGPPEVGPLLRRARGLRGGTPSAGPNVARR